MTMFSAGSCRIRQINFLVGSHKSHLNQTFVSLGLVVSVTLYIVYSFLAQLAELNI